MSCEIQVSKKPCYRDARIDILHPPIYASGAENLLKFEDPEGGAQDAHRFSTRQDAASKNPEQLSDDRFASALSVFFGWRIQLVDATH